MKRLTCILAIVLGTVGIATPLGIPEIEDVTVTGTTDGIFPVGSALGPVMLDSLELGTGVIIDADGSASGVFHAVLLGALLGQPQQITVEGKVLEGAAAPGGQARFNGDATVDLGDGTPPVIGVPFSVTASTGGLVLSLGTTTLPAATLPERSLTID
jgi:hypothetical protein